MKHRKVGMDELFYDLVFAYAISSLTGILENTFSGRAHWILAAVYLLSFVVMINSWMYQAVYTNRFGGSGILSSFLIMVQAGVLLFLASTLQTPSEQIFVPFALALGILSLLLFLEYLASFFKAKTDSDRRLIRIFLMMIAIRTALILLGAAFPVSIGIWISISGVLLGWILPAFFREPMKKKPIDFSHLSERLSLLVILMFGEMIISLSGWFTPDRFGLYSVLVFFLGTLLYQSYVQIYSRIQKNRSEILTGVHAIYLHYPILLGLNLVTSGMARFSELDVHPSSFACVLFFGLLLYFSGLYGCVVYLSGKERKKLKWIWLFLPMLLALCRLSLLFDSQNAAAAFALAGVAGQYFVLYRSLRSVREEV